MVWDTKWVMPELFLKHKGIRIYHAYKNDEISAGQRLYYYMLDPDHGEDNAFDVRELKSWIPPEHPPYLCGKANTAKNRKEWEEYMEEKTELTAIRAAIRKAIEEGEIVCQKNQ